MDICKSFPPIASKDAHTLILGSMPGVKSLEEDQYYAHPRNLFWPIMAELFNASIDTYPQRSNIILINQLAIWDVLKYCHRKGSLDTAIKDKSIEVNDFAVFLERHPKIDRIFFNGTKAEKEFMKRVYPQIKEAWPDIEYKRLPSTSPAMASMDFAEKLKAWSIVKPS